MKKLQFLLPIMMLVVLAGGLLLHIGTVDRYVSEMENRELTTANVSPTMGQVLSGEWFRDVEGYISDQFPLRDWWMQKYTQFQMATGKTFLAEKYYVDQDTGWILAQAAEEKGEEVVGMATTFIELNRAFRDVGIPFTAMTLPAKATYARSRLPEYLPEDKGEQDNALLHRLLAAADVDNIRLVDVMPGFDAEKMYYKTDHHWNLYGAYRGYEAMVTQIGERLGEAIEPVAYDDSKTSCLPHVFEGSWNKLLYMTVETDDRICYNHPESFETQFTIKESIKNDAAFQDIYGRARDFDDGRHIGYAEGYSRDFSILEIENDSYDSDKHIVILKDSYFNPVQFHVASHFRQLTIIDLRYFEEDVAGYLQGKGVDHVFAAYNDRNFNVVERY